MTKSAEEWLKQAEYDFDTAGIMRQSGRNFYAVFMCHMSVEKALKALVFRKSGTVPPKTHNLLLLLTHGGIKPPDTIGRFIVQLNEANVATRYPDELAKMIRTYNDDITDAILAQAREIVSWIKTMP
jgi:HEPN domain-containing protein